MALPYSDSLLFCPIGPALCEAPASFTSFLFVSIKQSFLCCGTVCTQRDSRATLTANRGQRFTSTSCRRWRGIHGHSSV